ncbi:MAG: beta-ketoacyl-ACP synthase II [Chloroflexi bacterium]|nr:beta-ketoacyl-ACP synthase II [Chloroflexota bacterium]
MNNDNKNIKRTVITGMGVISPIGSGIDVFWDGLVSGKSGIRRITQFDSSHLPCQIAGEIPDFEPSKFLDRKEARRIPRSGQIALAAAIMAVEDAGLPDTMPIPERASVIFGTAIGGIDRVVDGVKILHEQGFDKVTPFILPFGIPNLSAFLIAKQFQCLGRNSTITASCATGTQTIGEATELIRRGLADIVITGGTEALITDFAIAGFSAMRAMPTNFNNDPERASRPFDAKREGFIFSEGAGVLVLENLEHAQSRGAHIYAEVIGHATSADAYHIAAPDPEAAGQSRVMRWALEDAGVAPEDVDYINAHGTSTPINDVSETQAIKKVFGEHAYTTAISSSKSMLGHAMGASGALEAIVCALILSKGWITPTINYEFPDPECDLDYVPNQARQKKVNIALSNSFGLGGQNACLILKKYE